MSSLPPTPSSLQKLERLQGVDYGFLWSTNSFCFFTSPSSSSPVPYSKMVRAAPALSRRSLVSSLVVLASASVAWADSPVTPLPISSINYMYVLSRSFLEGNAC